MAEIQKTLDNKHRLTVFTVSGKVSVDEIISLTEQFYTSDLTLNILFDLMKADMSSMTADHMKKIIHFSKKYAYEREGGKTAYVMSSDLGYGLARMFEAYAEMNNHPVSHGVFKDKESAMTWIME